MKSYIFFKWTQVIFLILFFIVFMFLTDTQKKLSVYDLFFLFSGLLSFLIFWSLDMFCWIRYKRKEQDLILKAGMDPLTGLPAPSILKQELTKLSCSVLCDDISCVIITFDNIHHLNHTYGHPVGDIVLREFADILRDSALDIGFIARKSGRTFLALFRENSHTNTELFLQRLRTSVEIHNHTNGLLPISYLASVSYNDELHYASIYDLIKVRKERQRSPISP